MLALPLVIGDQNKLLIPMFNVDVLQNMRGFYSLQYNPNAYFEKINLKKIAMYSQRPARW